MNKETKQETIINTLLRKHNKCIFDSRNNFKLNMQVTEINNILLQYFFKINYLTNEQINKNLGQYITNINFLFHTTDFKPNEEFDLLQMIQLFLVIYSKTNDADLKHDILDLVEFMIQYDQNILLFIIKKTDFIQNFMQNFSKIQVYEEKMQFIHFLSTIPLIENEEIIQFYTENKFIEFICLEFTKFSSSTDNHDPEVLFVLTQLLNQILNFYSQIQLLSTEEIHLILSIFFMIIENKNEFYFFDLFVDEIISSLIQSMKIVNPSFLLESGLYNQFLSSLYSIDCYQHDKKLLFIFFTKFFKSNTSNELFDQLDFETLSKFSISSKCPELYPYIFDLFKLLIFNKPDFMEFLIQISFIDYFLERIKDQSYKLQISLWSLIITNISKISPKYSETILNNQNLVNNLFSFLRITLSDEDFINEHIDFLIQSSAESFHIFQYYQSCLNDFFLELYDKEPEVFDKFKDFISIKELVYD